MLYQSFGKRLLDTALAVVLLLPAVPLLALGALLVRLSLGRPVLFVQPRLGRDGHVWRVAKLRTMRPGPEPDAARTPAVGRLLRRTKVDELLQVLDVLAGRLSVIGPRPLPPGIMPDSDPLLPLRLSVRPGLTGWAQVCGGTLLANPEKLALDCYYARRVSAAFDARILARTLVTLAVGERRDEAAISAALADAQHGFTDAAPADAMR
jgi:lipopolysaccharide/colanic/teichoic acid biosynthesis glycosyltransferase